MLDNPAVEGRDLLDVLLLGGVGFVGRDIYLLLDTVGDEGALELEVARGDVVVSGALGTEADVDGLDIGGGVPLACHDVFLGDAGLGGLDGGDEGAQTIDLDGVALGEELDETADHLGEDTLDDVAAIDAVVTCHVVGEATQRDGFLLYGLGVVLAVAARAGVVVLTKVDLELRIFDLCHNCFF